MSEDFYLTLLSNSSRHTFPSNKTSHFDVQLNKEICLSGDWEVALSEIIYPNTIYNVSTAGDKIHIKHIFEEARDENYVCITKSFHLKIQNGHYSSIERLVSEINFTFSKYFEMPLLDVKEKQIIVNRKHKFASTSESVFSKEMSIVEGSIRKRDENSSGLLNKLEVRFDPRLALQLGFNPEENIFDSYSSKNEAALVNGISNEIFIYINLIEPQVISDTSAQVLKIIKALDRDSNYGETLCREVLNRNYIPLDKKRFQVVSIELRDSLGNFIPFSHGLSIVQVHFRKVSSKT